MQFNNNQIEFLKEIGLSNISFNDLTDADYVIIEEKVTEHLQKNGFDAEYMPTKVGIMCESILDML